MSQDELREHASYLADAVKLDRYRRAMRHHVAPGSVVLDLGAGSGILGLLAAQAGAARVYAVDSGSIIRQNGFGDRIVHLQASSHDVTLPERVDVAVCDQIGGFVYEPGLLTAFADVRRRLLRPGGPLVPGRFRLLLAPASAELWANDVSCWRARTEGLDFTPFGRLAEHTEFRVDLDGSELLGAPGCVATIDGERVDPVTGEVSLTIERAGEVGGLVGLFEAELAPGVWLSNVPGSPDQMRRWQNFYPLPSPVVVDEGDRLDAQIDLRPVAGAMTWRVQVLAAVQGEQPPRRKACALGTTAQGTFLSRRDLELNADDHVPLVDERVQAARFVLGLVDGARTKRQIVELTMGQGFSFLGDEPRATDFVSTALARYARPDATEHLRTLAATGGTV
jgi:protein arginine N-methyltransferase 1